MFSRQTYIDRRSTLASRFESGLLLLPGNTESPMNYADNCFHFRQDSTFLYYFGLDQADLAAVIDIDRSKLPPAEVVNGWSSEHYADTLRHVLENPYYNLHVRQLLHVGYKVAAQMGDRYYGALKTYEADVARNVTGNLWERHIKMLFLD